MLTKDQELDQELRKKAYYYNMKKICEVSGINYDTYKGWKNKGFGMDASKKEKLLEAMKKVAQ